MGDLLLNTLPYALAAAAAAPVVAVVTALILTKAGRPLLGAWVFTAAAGTLDAVAATILLVVFWGQSDAAAGDVGAVIDIVLGAAFAALGLMAIFQRESPNQEAAQRERIDRFLSQGLRGLVILGVGAQVINVDAFAVFAAGLKEIVADQPPVWQAMVTVAVMLAVMLVPYYAPALAFAASPQRAGRALNRMSDWLLAHSRSVEIIVGVGFGATFLAKGVTSL
jgi:hypothetical protein